MAKGKTTDFAALPPGTELETPLGVGQFIGYKKGNFKAQNVLVEHAPGRLKWYTEKELESAAMAQQAGAAPASDRQAFSRDFLYYPL